LFPEAILFGSERRNAYFSRLPKVANNTFLPNSSIELKGTSTACVRRKLSCEKEEDLGNCFSMRIELPNE
jgi:hypothetical protein